MNEMQNNESFPVRETPDPASVSAKNGNNTIKYVCIGLGAAVVVLLIVVAFLLGRNSGKKNDPAAQTALPDAAAQTTAGPQSGEAGTAGTAVPDASANTSANNAAQTTVPGAQAVNAPQNLDISMTSGSLTFVAGDQFNIGYDDGVIKVSEQGDTVTIENTQRHPSASERHRMNVTVTVPESYYFKSVDIEFGAGKLIVHSLKTEALDLELGAGSATFDDLQVTGSAEIQEGAGELAIKSGSIMNLTLQCGAGATRVSAAVLGASSVSAAVGAVDLNFAGSETDYTVAFQIGLGACYFKNEKISRSGSFGTGPNIVDITGGFGVMRVNVD